MRNFWNKLSRMTVSEIFRGIKLLVILPKIREIAKKVSFAKVFSFKVLKFSNEDIAHLKRIALYLKFQWNYIYIKKKVTLC